MKGKKGKIVAAIKSNCCDEGDEGLKMENR